MVIVAPLKHTYFITLYYVLVSVTTVFKWSPVRKILLLFWQQAQISCKWKCITALLTHASLQGMVTLSKQCSCATPTCKKTSSTPPWSLLRTQRHTTQLSLANFWARLAPSWFSWVHEPLLRRLFFPLVYWSDTSPLLHKGHLSSQTQ